LDLHDRHHERAVNEAQLRKELFEILSGEALWLRCKVDNAPALSAVKKCYSKPQRLGIGFINVLIEDADKRIDVTFVLSAEQKADIFTKALLLPAPFPTACDAVNVCAV